ncbi:SDR family oxidoreductase [Cupriavidus sp. 8B]
MEPTSLKVALVIDAGDSTGGAIARRFAREGFVVCATRRDAEMLTPLLEEIRDQEGNAHGFGSNARKEEEVVALIEKIESEIGPIEVLVLNIGANVPCSILDETVRKYFKIWEIACFSGFLNGREVARRMVARGRSTILFTGATAGIHGSANFAAFCRCQACAARAGSKHGSRTGSEEHPRGPRCRQRSHRHRIHPQQFPPALCSEQIAGNYWFLHTQPRDAWTHELDLRPYMGRF